MKILTDLVCAAYLLSAAPAFAGGYSAWKSVPVE